MLRILIADDHTVTRKGIKQILLEEFPAAYIEDVADAEDLIKKVITGKWDLVISDINMPGRSGLDALPQIKIMAPALPVLILSVNSEDEYAIRALKAGASGFLNKVSASEELIKAVHKILIGKKYISAVVAEKLVSGLTVDENKPLHANLSNREFDVMKALASGKTIAEIANALTLSSTTVSTYRARVLIKLNMKTNANLIKYAIENQLI